MDEGLRRIGLGEYESKVYLALLTHGPLTGTELVKASGVPQGKVYNVLYRLEEKRFVTILDVRPKRFRAIAPAIAVKAYLRSRKQELEELEKALPARLAALPKALANERATDELITVYRGRKAIDPIMLDRYATARVYIKDMFTFEYLPAAILRAIKGCADRGVTIKMLATKNGTENLALVRQVQRVGIEVRYYPVNEMRLAVKDGVEAYQGIVNPRDLMDRVSLVIGSKELTNALETYFDHVWKKAEKL